MNQEEIAAVVRSSVEEYEQSFSRKLPADRPLYGEGGSLDSLGLVQFLGIVEQNIEDTTGDIITIASEKAVSQRNSPFRSIESLTEYIAGIFREKNDA